MTDHKHAGVLAYATLRDIIGVWSAMQAAVIRGEDAEADTLRKRAHDLLDSYMDFGVEAALAVKALQEG